MPPESWDKNGVSVDSDKVWEENAGTNFGRNMWGAALKWTPECSTRISSGHLSVFFSFVFLWVAEGPFGSVLPFWLKKHKQASTYRHKVVKFWDSISIVYCKDHAIGEAPRTASECSKEMTKGDSTTKEDGSTTSRTASFV
ncbi:hypothetical protein ACP70R_038699 [Stipagrostis hirtigluma subsp. patula]